jgi:hypothetical protein
MLDDEKRGRSRLGGATLTEREVARIKYNLGRGYKPRSIADAYGVAVETIRRLARGETWSWVEPSPDGDDSVVELTPEILASAERVRALAGLTLADNFKKEIEKEIEVDKALDKLQESH